MITVLKLKLTQLVPFTHKNFYKHNQFFSLFAYHLAEFEMLSKIISIFCLFIVQNPASSDCVTLAGEGQGQPQEAVA